MKPRAIGEARARGACPGSSSGKRLFEGFTTSFEVEHIGVHQSPFATFIDYRVKT
jgi:hypothetical protein